MEEMTTVIFIVWFVIQAAAWGAILDAMLSWRLAEQHIGLWRALEAIGPNAQGEKQGE